MKLETSNISYKLVRYCYCFIDKCDYSYWKATICYPFIIDKAGKAAVRRLQNADMTQLSQGHSTNLC